MAVPFITDEVAVQAAADTGGTTQTIALSLGGLTPWFVAIIAYRALIDEGETVTGTPDEDAVCSWGCTDGTNEWANAVMSEHGASPVTDTRDWLRSDRIVLLMDPADGTAGAAASFVSWGADQLVINWDDGPDGLWRLVVYAQAGGGGSAEVGIATSETDTGGSVTVTHSLGVAPRGFVAATGAQHTVADTATSNMTTAAGRFTLGYGSYDGSTIRQCSSCIGWVNGSAVGTIGARLSTDRILAPVTHSIENQPHLEITAVDSTDVTFTTRNQTQSMDFGYAFIAGVECFAGVWTLPTGTGSKTFDMPAGPNDVRPKGILMTHTRLQVAEFDTDNTTLRAGTMGWSAIGGEDGGSGTGCITHQRLTVPANAHTFFDDIAYHNIPHDASGSSPHGTWVSYDTDGWTLDSHVSNANEIGFPMLLIGGVRVAPTGLAIPITFGEPTLTLVLAPDGFAIPITFGSPTLSLVIAPDGLAIPITFGGPTLTLLLAPDGLAIPILFGEPTLALSQVIAPDGLAIPITFGSPTLTLVIAPDGFAIAVTFGEPSLTLLIEPDGLTIAIMFGEPRFLGLLELAPSPMGQVVQGGSVLGIVSQSGMVAGQMVQGGPVLGQTAQGGAVAGHVVQGGPVQGQVSQNA